MRPDDEVSEECLGSVGADGKNQNGNNNGRQCSIANRQRMQHYQAAKENQVRIYPGRRTTRVRGPWRGVRTTAVALAHLVLTAACLAEVGHGR